jgi:phosphate uptake regulator
MAKRKIIKQASQAYTFTLPIDWIRQNNLDRKDSEVEVSQLDRSLIISNPGNVALKKAKISVDNLNIRNIWSKFNALYASGIDEIEINSSEEISNLIREAINEDIGYALVSQEKGKYFVKDLGGGNNQNIDEIFKQVFQIVLMFYDSAIEDIFGKENETKESLEKRDKEINKFCLFLQRQINKMSYSDPVKGRVLFTYSYALEKIGDEILRLWRTNIEYKIQKTEKIREIINLSRKSLDLVFDFYYNFSYDLGEKVYNLKDKARKELLTLSKIDGKTSRFLHYALQIIEDSADLTHLNLMRNLT